MISFGDGVYVRLKCDVGGELTWFIAAKKKLEEKEAARKEAAEKAAAEASGLDHAIDYTNEAF